jgi:hypothetical protein
MSSSSEAAAGRGRCNAGEYGPGDKCGRRLDIFFELKKKKN